MQGISCEMPGWMTHKLESIAGENINSFRCADDTTQMAENWSGPKEPFDESEWAEWKIWLKTQYSIFSQSPYIVFFLHYLQFYLLYKTL